MQWQKPNEGWIKINTDAAFDPGTCTGSAGVVIRNHDGLVQAAAARWFDDTPDVLTAEAMAAKEGLELAVECGLFSRSMVCFRVDWVCREANSVAHRCAKMVTATERSQFWLDYIPEWLSGIAASDLYSCY
ncbi:hypothetical protein HU200_043600 [Digitaria exilis]|uniref:RNase H type-1 domain-containing protein n=1 Tax=Digitaria exilis TaxID=1010633 RepID=A0A835B2U6_9POAL|nr:hypothetical protein HU200_043600 [Digitaria exilis]